MVVSALVGRIRISVNLQRPTVNHQIISRYSVSRMFYRPTDRDRSGALVFEDASTRRRIVECRIRQIEEGY